MKKLEVSAEVFTCDVNPRDWVVQAIERVEGRIFTAIFSGPNAEANAIEYAEAKYREFQRHAPHPQPYRLYQGGADDRQPSGPSRDAKLRLVK